jgi:hypothetical protein
MSDEQIFAEIRKLIERAGEVRVLSALTGKGVSPTTAERMVKGRYSSKPTGLMKQALLAILEENKAS